MIRHERLNLSVQKSFFHYKSKELIVFIVVTNYVVTKICYRMYQFVYS
jgi:hypothetical protein